MLREFKSLFIPLLFIFLFAWLTWSMGYEEVLRKCLEEPLSPTSQLSSFCLVQLNSSAQCQASHNLRDCSKAAASLVRNEHSVDLGRDLGQFSLLSGHFCYSPRPQTLPPRTYIFAVSPIVTLSLGGGLENMKEIPFWCVFGNLNVTAEEVSQTECCVEIPVEYFTKRTAFYFEPFVLPYSSNSDPPDESALWIELRKLRTSSMKGKKVGKVNLSSVASQTNSARDRNDVLTYTTTTKPKEKDDDSDSESRKRPPTFVKVGQILILAIIFLVLFLAAIYMLIIACFKITRNINNQPKY